MVKEPVFRGAATALITPLNKNGVDFRSLGKLIDWQIEQGIDALVIVGTTGEKSTLTSLEHLEVVRYAIERADHRVPIIVGTGSKIPPTPSTCHGKRSPWVPTHCWW